MGLTFCATGDTIITCPYTKDYEGCEELVAFIRSADVRMNNMETPLVDGPCPVSAFSGRPWMRGETALLDRLADFGFNCYSFANNHGLDYFYTGLLSTLEAFEKRGIAYAGAGRSLEEAVSHCLIDTPNGRVAFLAIASVADVSVRAGSAGKNILPRPGINQLRHTVRYRVTAEQMQALTEIADASKINSRLKNRLKLGSVVLNDGIFPFGTMEFAVGEPGRETIPDPYDMERMEKAVKRAAAEADRTVVYLHSHETKGDSDAEPDWFAEEFARRAIDWGADAVVGSGTHQVKGVEFYRGRPIFYGIANFFFRPFDMDEYPEEWYELYRMDKSLSTREAEDLRTKHGTRGLVTQAYAYRAIVPRIEWEGDKITVKALPISLGFGGPAETKGFPRPAGPEDTEALLTRMRELCEPYGTRVDLGEDGCLSFTPGA